jgi:ribonuclease HI
MYLYSQKKVKWRFSLSFLLENAHKNRKKHSATMVTYNRLIVYFDGASRNNPRGPAGCGWELWEMDNNGADSRRIACGQKYLGCNVSTNQAEYEGLEAALAYMNENDISCNGLYIRGDSQIVIKQFDGFYRVRSQNIIGYYKAVELGRLDKQFVNYTLIDCSRNSYADGLANDAIVYEEDHVWAS